MYMDECRYVKEMYKQHEEVNSVQNKAKSPIALLYL